ncbi:MAG: prepilin-type N-terminal cleavage/methylation domain-containing protein [Elusimicrobiales bacterium]
MKGYTLLELLVTATVLGVLISYGVPQFQKSFEQSRVDLAGAHLESIWTAQRLFKAQNATFAQGIGNLGDFLDASFINSACVSSDPCGTVCDFCYRFENVTSTAFTAVAQRNSGKTTFWDGSILLTEAGTLTGSTYAPRTGAPVYQILPAQF